MLAPAFTERYDAPARAVTVIEHGTDPAEAEKTVNEAEETLKASGLDVELVVFRRREVAYGDTRGDLDDRKGLPLEDPDGELLPLDELLDEDLLVISSCVAYGLLQSLTVLHNTDPNG